jgi:hypothetical protein
MRRFPLIPHGMVLGLTALATNLNLLAQNETETAAGPFRFEAGMHETRTELLPSPEVPNLSEIPGEPEIPPPTRSSFMASWQRVSDAIGYRLDVSTDNSFSNYLDGYHDLDVGNLTGLVVTGLDQGTTYYYRVRPYYGDGPTGSYSEVMMATTVATVGLIIQPTFDGSITNRPDAATIEAMINRAIGIYESLFTDPITIQIRFRYATTAPNGTPLLPGSIAQSNYIVYAIPWSTYLNALRADAKTSNDHLANATLPTTALSPNLRPSSGGGRAVGLNTPPAMFANGSVGLGGPYDGIITLNSSYPYQFIRPPMASNFDAQSAIEHEMDEIIGLGSHLNSSSNELRPQDLFSWSSAGHRNSTSSGTRYFSINGGITNIVGFSQTPNSDFGDWVSELCPQAHPYVQNASLCRGQASDVTGTSPEGVNLDVVGYDLVNTAVTDLNGNGKPDFVLFNPITRRTAIWLMDNNVRTGNANGPTLSPDWSLVGVADFNRDGHPDFLLFNAATRLTTLWYLNGNSFVRSASGPILPRGQELVAIGDFNSDGYPDLVLYNSSTRRTTIWYMSNNAHVGTANGPTLPVGWSLVAVADFNAERHPDYLLFNSITRQSKIWYLNGSTLSGTASGPTISVGYQLVGAADFDGNGRPDYVLVNPVTRQTAIWYMKNHIRVDTRPAPILAPGSNLIAP